jgi:hypothetical protein
LCLLVAASGHLLSTGWHRITDENLDLAGHDREGATCRTVLPKCAGPRGTSRTNLVAVGPLSLTCG